MSMPARSRGFTVLELLLGILIIGSMSLVLVQLFRTTLLSSQTAARAASFLGNARKTVGGETTFQGLALDGEDTILLTAVSSTSFSFKDTAGVVSTYTLTSAGDLRTTRAGVTKVRARGISSLTFTYYARDSDYLVYETTDAAAARMMAVSFQMAQPRRTVSFFSGGSSRNHE